jgi:hypothetical protein
MTSHKIARGDIPLRRRVEKMPRPRFQIVGVGRETQPGVLGKKMAIFFFSWCFVRNV